MRGAAHSFGTRGSLWVDSVNSKLLRVEFNTIEIESGFPIKDYSGRTDFGDVNITDAGQFLLPVVSETVECQILSAVTAMSWSSTIAGSLARSRAYSR